MGVAAPLLHRSRLIGGLPGLPAKPPRIPATPFRFALYKTAGWIAFTLGILSCLWLHPTPPSPSIFDSGRTAYGFFHAPPDVDFFSGIAIYGSIAEHGDVVMIQQGVAWDEFREGSEGDWIYLLLDDLNMESYGKYFADHGQAEMTETMRWFSVVGLRSSDGVPKEALAVWDGFRN
ncbi:MAG: hypothetical protein ACK2UB_06640 [Anaerolineales bacterium]